MTIVEHLKNKKINFTTDDNIIFDIDGFGKVLYEDFTSKKSIYRSSKGNNEEEILLNIFYTKDELEQIGIKAVAFYFGDMYNYVSLDDATLQLKPLANIGNIKLNNTHADYANLGIHTNMELLNGSGGVDDYIVRAKFLGHKYLGVCDYNTMGSILSLQRKCDDAGISPVFGYSTLLSVVETENPLDECAEIKLYVKNQRGLSSMHRIQKSAMVDSDSFNVAKVVSKGFDASTANAKGYLTMDNIRDFSEGLIFVIGKWSAKWFMDRPQIVDELISIFGEDIYFQIDFNEYKANRIDMMVLESLKMYLTLMSNKVKPILIPDTYYVNDFEYKNKINLNKISDGVAHLQSDQQWYKDIEEIHETFDSIVETEEYRQMLHESAENSIRVAEQCYARYDLHINHMPLYDLSESEAKKYTDQIDMFDKLLEDGFREKILNNPDKAPLEQTYRERLEMEKYVIKSTNNVNYMLNQYDVIAWAENEAGITVGAGRGSAGGSLILYLLNVIKVDPIRFNLLFERFLLPERAGLYEAQVTKIDEEVDDSIEVVEIELEDGRKITLDVDSQIIIDGGERPMYADELKVGDDMLFDNIHNLFDIK